MNQLFEIARLCLGKGGLRKKVWLILPNESEELSAHSKDGVVAWASSVLKSSGLDISILSSVAFSSLLSKNILPDEEPALILYDPKDDTSALLLSGLYTLERPKLREVCDRSFGLHMSQPGTISGYTNLRHSGHQLQVIDCYEHDPLALLKYVYSQLLYFHYIHDDVTHSKAESNAVQIHLYLRDDFAYDSKLNIIKHIKKVDHLGPLSQFSLKDFSPDQQHLVIIGAKRLDASLLNTLKVFGLLSGQQRFYTRLVILEPLQEVELQLLNLLQGVSRVDVHCIATGLELGDIKLLNKEQEVHKKLIASLNVPTDYWLSQANSFVSVCFNEPAVDLSRVGFEWRLSAERATGESSHRLFLGIKFSFYDDESKEVNKSDLHSLIVRALVQHLEPSNECLGSFSEMDFTILLHRSNDEMLKVAVETIASVCRQVSEENKLLFSFNTCQDDQQPVNVLLKALAGNSALEPKKREASVNSTLSQVEKGCKTQLSVEEVLLTLRKLEQRVKAKTEVVVSYEIFEISDASDIRYQQLLIPTLNSEENHSSAVFDFYPHGPELARQLDKLFLKHLTDTSWRHNDCLFMPIYALDHYSKSYLMELLSLVRDRLKNVPEIVIQIPKSYITDKKIEYSDFMQEAARMGFKTGISGFCLDRHAGRLLAEVKTDFLFLESSFVKEALQPSMRIKSRLLKELLSRHEVKAIALNVLNHQALAHLFSLGVRYAHGAVMERILSEPLLAEDA